jgi:hypothetical protein
MYDDADGQFTWWWNQLNVNEDWNSMTPEARRRLTFKLKQCCADLTKLSITETELLPLVEATGILTVFEAVLSLWALQGKEKKSRESLLAYLRKVVINSWNGQLTIKPTWHKEPERKKRGKIASLETILKHDPFRINQLTCRICGDKILKTNRTGVCSACQRKGNGKEGECKS